MHSVVHTAKNPIRIYTVVERYDGQRSNGCQLADEAQRPVLVRADVNEAQVRIVCLGARQDVRSLLMFRENPVAKLYSLMPADRKQLQKEMTQWQRYTGAIALVLES